MGISPCGSRLRLGVRSRWNDGIIESFLGRSSMLDWSLVTWSVSLPPVTAVDVSEVSCRPNEWRELLLLERWREILEN